MILDTIVISVAALILEVVARMLEIEINKELRFLCILAFSLVWTLLRYSFE